MRKLIAAFETSVEGPTALPTGSRPGPKIRLIVYPLIAGKGKPLFATTDRRRGLELRKCEQLQDGRLSLIYSQR
jgi:hypothetical protein